MAPLRSLCCHAWLAPQGGPVFVSLPAQFLLSPGTRLSRPMSNPELLAEEKQQFLDNQGERNGVEDKIGQGKRQIGLTLIREKLSISQCSSIEINVLTMKLEKPQEFSCPFAALLNILVMNERTQSVLTLPLKRR
jgi:hypothetical protein